MNVRSFFGETAGVTSRHHVCLYPPVIICSVMVGCIRIDPEGNNATRGDDNPVVCVIRNITGEIGKSFIEKTNLGLNT